MMLTQVLRIVLLAALTFAAAPGSAAPGDPAIVDPPRNASHPARNQQLLIPSHGVGLNALLLQAAGAGLHPTVILMHGLPGNERNLDLAQAIRRSGWSVLTFTYRGAWGSPGDFSIGHAMEDSAAALEFARSAEAARLGVDRRHLVLAGHSMGGATAAMTASRTKGLDGLILLEAADFGDRSNIDREKLAAGLDDLGNALKGTSALDLADEMISRGGEWDLVRAATSLGSLPVLTINAAHGIGAANRPVTAALRRARVGVTAIDMDTDHSFADHRIALSKAVVGWLTRLRAAH